MVRYIVLSKENTGSNFEDDIAGMNNHKPKNMNCKTDMKNIKKKVKF